MPNEVILKGMNVLHKGLLKVSGGRAGWTAGKMPVLELTTTGRKSGQARSVMLTSPYQHGDDIVVVASRGGDDIHPDWFLNLRNDPSVTVVWKGEPAAAMSARILSSEERAEVWPQIVAQYSNYGGYQEKTDREIPLVALSPA